MKAWTFFALICLLLTTSARAEDWPRFMGPDLNSTSPETGLAKTWPQAGPKVLWTVPLGEGFGGAAIADGNVYVLDRAGEKGDVLRCLDFKTGKELWNFTYDAPGKFDFPGSRSTPTVDQEFIYILGSLGDLHCIDKKTHQSVWACSLVKDFGAKNPHWGFGQSPLVYKNMLIVAPTSKECGVVALDKKTGKPVWKSPAFGGDSGYCSPILARIGGTDQILAITTKGVNGLDAESGKQLWFYGGWNCKIPIASPVVLSDGRVFLTGEYGAGSAMIQIGAIKTKDGGFAATELYKTKVCEAQIHQPLLYKDHLYANSNGNSRHEGLICMDLDGKLKWKTGKNPGFERGGLILVDGMIVIMDGATGDLRLVEANPAAYKELAKAKVLEGAKIWGPLAFSDGKLVLRDQKQMKCLDLKNP